MGGESSVVYLWVETAGAAHGPGSILYILEDDPQL